MAVPMGAAWLVPWIALIGWALLLARLRRRRPWLRSAPLAAALVVTTLAADAATVVATARMSVTSGRSLALALLWIACILSVTTYLVLRTPDDGRDDPGSGTEPPEPPWWPEFERSFRDYCRSGPRAPQAPRPKEPANQP
jgi:hypothetical protein